MRMVKFSVFIIVCASFFMVNGCNSELNDLKIQNDTQRQRIASLESELQVANLELDKLRRQLAAFFYQLVCVFQKHGFASRESTVNDECSRRPCEKAIRLRRDQYPS